MVANNAPFEVTGTARVATGSVGRVQVQIQDRDSGQYLRTTAPRSTPWTQHRQHRSTRHLGAGTTTRTWSIPATGSSPPTATCWSPPRRSPPPPAAPATPPRRRRRSSRSAPRTRHRRPSITGPSGVQTSTTFTMTGTANDDKGVNSLSYWFRDEQQRYLQADGTVDDIFNTFRGDARRHRCHQRHLVLRGHPAARGRVARQRHGHRHHRPGRPAQRHPRLDASTPLPSRRP